MKSLRLLRHVLAATLSLVAATLAHPAPALPDSAFDDDHHAPISIHEMGRETRNGALVRDIIFAPLGKPVKAYLVGPVKSEGTNAGILYVHWLSDSSNSNRTEFLDEAVALANRGVVSLLVDGMWAYHTWYNNRAPEEDFDRSIRQVNELRRSMELLIAQPGVDSQRIACVGHDFGALYSMLAGALDRRAKTYVFMAGVPHFVDWFLYSRQPQDLPAYQAQIAPLDPVNYLARLAPATVFFQFASKDQFVTAAQAAELYAAANPLKQMATYDAAHDLRTPDASSDRIVWLARELELRK